MAEMPKFSIDQMSKSVTVHITLSGYKGWLIKKNIGLFLIRCGIKIIGMNVKIDEVKS